ncbi:pilus assembly protein N-terminal domain-containing protein [Candidatus Omnitrophota bacterium]
MCSSTNGKVFKIAVLFIVTIFSISSICTAQGNVQIPQVASGSAAAVHYSSGTEKKMIYPSDIKSILIKEAGEKLFIDQSKAVVVRFPEPFMRAAVGDPEIADIVVLSEEEIIINAKKHGNTNLIVWYETGVYNNYDIIVGMDFSKLETVLNSVIKGKGEVSVFDANKAVVLKGHVTNAATYEKVEKIAESFIATIQGSSIVNLIAVDQTEQILLEVRFLEISHSLAEKQGVDLHFLTSNLTGYSWLGQSGTAPNEDNAGGPLKNGRIGSDLLDVGSTFGEYQVAYEAGGFIGSGVIDDLESKGILKIIANPDLITKNKEEASFLAGGEFPVVTVNQEEMNVEYKDYGVQLTFLPEITERDTIRLKVNPVVSLLDFTKGAVTVNSVLIPALITRRTETTVELESGKTLVISGLHTKEENTVNSDSPLFSNIPILGKLFSTTNFTGNELELIVVVTPHIVTPFNMNQGKKFFDPNHVEHIINMSHLDIPEEQGNEMKRLLSQTDIVREEQAREIIESAVTQKYEDDIQKESLKRAENEMVEYLADKAKDEKKDTRLRKREVRIQKAEEMRMEKERQEELERLRADEKKRQEAEKKQREKDEKKRQSEDKKRRKKDEEQRVVAAKAQEKENQKRAEKAVKKETRKIERQREKKEPSVENQRMIKSITERDPGEEQAQIASLDQEIEAKRQDALALYKEGKAEEGKELLAEMFDLKQKREQIASLG